MINIKVWPGSKKPYIFSGAIFFRRGNLTVQASTKELSALIHERSQTERQRERLPVAGVELEDFDLDEINKAVEAAMIGDKNLESKNTPLEFLSYYGLYQNGQFTNAVVILFAKQPFRFIPQTRVRLAYLQEGKTANVFTFDLLLEGNLFKNITTIQDFLEKLPELSRNFDDQKWQRSDFSYPMAALREGVINALVHSDYSVLSGSIAILIYKDSLEITNVGKLPIPLNELRKSHLSMPFNPDIAHIVFLRGYMEKIGRGTLKIIEACKSAGLKSPSWKNNNNIVTLSFFNEKVKTINKGAFDGLIEGAFKGAFPSDALLAAKTGAKTGAIIGGALFPGAGTAIGAIAGIIGSSIYGKTERVKENLILLISTIFQNEGSRVPEYIELTGLSASSIERYIKILKDTNLIEFKGESSQTGGYFLTEESKKQIESNL